MLSDFRYAIRGLHRAPGFALTAILSLALGIGANTAIFSLVNATLLRALPVRDPDRLIILTRSTPDRFAGNFISPRLYQQLREHNNVLDGFAAVIYPEITISTGGVAEHVSGQAVSGNYFDTLGVHAAIGRALTPEDDRPGGPLVCVISYGFWLRRLGGEATVIGQLIRIDGQAFTIAGVTPKEFTGFNQGTAIDVTATLSGFPKHNSLRTFGRLKAGVSRERAQAALDALFHQFEPGSGNAGSDIRVLLKPGAQGMGGLREQYGRPLEILMAVVGLVLLIACANVANLMMVRACGRAREIAVRLALGATRGRLLLQALVESLLLTGCGAVLALLLAYWLDRTLLTLAPRNWSSPIGEGGGLSALNVSPDWRVFLFTLGVAIVVSLLSGLVPALRSTRLETGPALKGGTGLRAPGRLSHAHVLAILQIAFSLVLLIGAGLCLRSLRNLKTVDPGFDPRHLLVVTIEPALAGYSMQATQNFFDRLLEHIRKLPGVASTSPSNVSPLSGDYSISGVVVPGHHPEGVSTYWVGPDFFKTFGTPLVSGRVFDEQDGRGNKVAIVNQKFAAHFWPGESPAGKRVMMGRDDDGLEILGVVKDVKTASLREEAQAAIYLPFRQLNIPLTRLFVRVADRTPALVISAINREVHDLDPNLAAYNATTMEAQLDGSITLDRLMGTLTTLFGLLGVVLAAIGLYGVMTFSVVARTREIGIRMALGAGGLRVLGQVLRESAALVGLGIALGLPVALWASRWAGSFLYGLSATDPSTYAAVAAALAAVTLVAAWIPARQAALVDPAVTLRSE